MCCTSLEFCQSQVWFGYCILWCFRQLINTLCISSVGNSPFTLWRLNILNESGVLHSGRIRVSWLMCPCKLKSIIHADIISMGCRSVLLLKYFDIYRYIRRRLIIIWCWCGFPCILLKYRIEITHHHSSANRCDKQVKVYLSATVMIEVIKCY